MTQKRYGENRIVSWPSSFPNVSKVIPSASSWTPSSQNALSCSRVLIPPHVPAVYGQALLRANRCFWRLRTLRTMTLPMTNSQCLDNSEGGQTESCIGRGCVRRLSPEHSTNPPWPPLRSDKYEWSPTSGHFYWDFSHWFIISLDKYISWTLILRLSLHLCFRHLCRYDIAYKISQQDWWKC